jgi:hypothetical protein
MKNKIGVAALVAALAMALLATAAGAQCTGYPGPMIVFSSNGYAYETNYASFMSTAGSQMTVVGKVSLFCQPFLDLDATSATTEYTFVWDGLVSQGTTTAVNGVRTTYTTRYMGGMFHIYAGSPPDIPATLPALPAPGVIPDTYANGTLILEGPLDSLVVSVLKVGTTTYTVSGSYRANYWCNGGTLVDRVGGGQSLLSGSWCPDPPSGSPGGSCALPTGWSAHPSGKWDSPYTTPVTPTQWGSIKILYR